jgi:hypothetical protein
VVLTVQAECRGSLPVVSAFQNHQVLTFLSS